MFEPAPFHPRRPTLVAPVRVDGSGRAGPTRGQARGTAWRRTSQGYYVPAAVGEDDPAQRILEASVSVPEGGAVTGWAALHWCAGHWFDGTAAGGRLRRPVSVATAGLTVRSQPGLAISEEGLSPEDVIEIDGLRVTTAVRSACFEMRYAATDRQAAVALSMAAYSDLVSIEEMTVYAAAHSGWTGIPRCRRALSLAVENAWSPTEVTMFLVWQHEGGRPRPLCNVPVFDRMGHHLGTPDLIDPEAGVIGEYEGSIHLAGQQRAVDIRREAVFREAGFEVVTMVAADLRDPTGFTRRLNAAYRRARQEAESTRSWTIEPPPWWIPTLTVAQRRALDAGQRARWLRHRLAA